MSSHPSYTYTFTIQIDAEELRRFQQVLERAFFEQQATVRAALDGLTGDALKRAVADEMAVFDVLAM